MIFNSLVHKVDQSVSKFILLFQKQAMKCNFGDQLDNHLRDRLVAGISDDSIKKKLLTESNLSWTTAIDIAISRLSVEKAIKVSTNEVKDSCTVFACSGAHSKINR